MKKYFSIALIAVMGLLAWSCADDNIVAVYNPDNVTAQTLGDVTGVTLSPDGDPIVIPFTQVDFGLGVPVSYTLYVAKAGTNFDPQQKVAVAVDTEKGTLTVKQTDLNTALLNLGAAADQDFEAEFKLVANALTDKNVPVASTTTTSATKTATFKAYEATLLDKDVYEIVYVQGSYAGWNFDNCQYLYNYSKDGHTYSGVVDLSDKAAEGIKVTGTNDWGNETGNWGFDDDSGTQEAEAGSLQLLNGSNTNVTAYSKRFYSFTFDKNSLVLKKDWGADQIGIIGGFNGWGDDVVMDYNADYVRFYADVDFAEATEFKFRADAGWDLNWGAGCVNGGDNIPCEAGQYRIYLDLNKKEIKIDANMYGKEEPQAGKDEPEPEPQPAYQGWGIIGSFNDWGGDAAMTEANGVWTGYVNLDADAEWKLRKDAGWDENVGGVFVNFGEPFAAVAGGDNIKLGQAGFFQVVYDTQAGTITVSEGDVWSLIGTLNGSNWDTDYFCTLTDGKWVSPEFTIEEGQEFKFRYNAGWDVNYGGAFAALGEAFEAVPGGDNIKLPAGKYVATLDTEAKTITVVNATKTWGVIGDFNSWSADEVMTEVAPGIWVSDMLTLAGGWKVRFDGGWDVNFGGTTPAHVGQFVQAVPGGDNIGFEGTFKVVLNTNNGTLGTLGWGLVGGIASLGFDWGEDLPMNLGIDGKWYSIPVALTTTDEFKIRKNAGWDENFGGTFAAVDEAFAAVAGGDNIKVAEDGTYMVVYDPEAATLTLTKGYWGVIGGFNSWGADDFMYYNGDGKWYSFNRTYEGEWKLRQGSDWAVNVGGTFGEVGTPFEVTQDGPNISVGETTGFGIVYDTAAGTITITTDKVL
ncbi:MAG: SusE domain-containing protein [Bacteroidaceae bacterium]|nr:SusE domain-containing protein [Bacteroidaceae bacterium]